MFRSIKRKTASSRLRSRDGESGTITNDGESGKISNDAATGKEDGSSSDEEPTTVVRRTNKNLKTKRTNHLLNKEPRNKFKPSSITTDEEENEDDADESFTKANSKRHKKHRRRGLGFGGQPLSTQEEDEEDHVRTSNGPLNLQDNVSTSAGATSSYGKEALEQLKSEQKTIPKDLVQSTPKDSIDKNSNVEEQNNNISEPLEEENYISLRDTRKSGKGFIDIAEKDNIQIDGEDRKEALDDNEEGSNWEDQIAKRAGITTTTTRPPPQPIQTPTLSALRENLNSALEHLRIRQEDLENVIMRREADLAQTKADLVRQEHSAKEAGLACGDFQQLRYDLTMWVGALRDLEERITPIQKELVQMLKDQFARVQQEWTEYQDDVCFVLQECDRLDRVLGRQPSELLLGGIKTQLDEFGRDLGARSRRERENRFHRRKQKRGQGSDENGGNEADNDTIQSMWLHDEEIQNRYSTLQESINSALDDLDEKYSSIDKLDNIFRQWKQEHPEEYSQCYAHLSLADLHYVFSQVKFCQGEGLRSLLKRGNIVALDEPFIQLPMASVEGKDSTGNLVSDGERQYRKFIIPFLTGVLRDSPIVVFLSSSISRQFAGPVSEIVSTTGSETNSARELYKSIASAVSDVLESVSIPLLNRNEPKEMIEWLDDCVQFAEKTQTKWIQQMVLNVLTYWMPILEKSEQYTSTGKKILGFLSQNYLFLLSSFSPALATEYFSPIWKCLSYHQDLLTSPGFFLESAPLRAASRAYGLHVPPTV